MPYVAVNGVDLWYEEQGEGPHLLVAHGLMGSVAMLPWFGERIEAIAARGVHVVAYDARGHGRSGYTRRPGDYSWQSLAADMHGLIVALGLGRTSIYGGSMGAGTALMLALEHPEEVERLILHAPPPFGTGMGRVRPIFAVLALMFQVLGPRLTGRVAAALPQVRGAPEAGATFDRRAFFAAQRRAAIVPAIRGLVLEGPPLPVHRFERITQPALILTHPDDIIHPLAAGELLHERMPHAQLAVAPSATYWEERPEALAHVIAAFVRGEPVAHGLPEKRAREPVVG